MNKDFRKFVMRLILFAALFISTLTIMFLSGIFIIGCQYEDGYCGAIIDKIARLKSINEPKIILTGDSNLAFGINSEMIESALRRPVVNLGLHGGLGNAFAESMAKLNINSEDIVIVCQVILSDDNRIPDPELAWITVEYHKDLWEIIRPEDYPEILRAFPIYWRKAVLQSLFPREKSDKTAYARKSFNKYGDVVYKPDKMERFIEKLFESDSAKLHEFLAVNDTCINRLNEFNRFVKSKGAVMLVTIAPIGKGKYTPPISEYEEFQRKLTEKLDCEVISFYRDHFIPYEYFYDGILHLNNQGAEIRTKQLIKDIKNWQKKHQRH